VLQNGTWFETLQDIANNLGDTVFPNAQFNPELYDDGIILKQKFPTSQPTGRPTSRPTPKYTPPPTVQPEPLIISVPAWLFAAIIIGLVIALFFAYQACCVPNINKLKIVAMVNEILDEEFNGNEESKEPRYKPY
jgi:hypothetical protein